MKRVLRGVLIVLAAGLSAYLLTIRSSIGNPHLSGLVAALGGMAGGLALYGIIQEARRAGRREAGK